MPAISPNKSTSPNQGKRVKKAIFVALAVFCIQFGISEFLYQVSLRTSDPAIATHLNTASNIVAWPADLFYEEVEKNLYLSSLTEIQSMAASGEDLPEEQLQKVQSLLQAYEESGDSDKFIFDTSEWLYEIGVDAYVPLVQTYAIYIGTCLAWAILIGALTYILSDSNPAYPTRDFHNKDR